MNLKEKVKELKNELKFGRINRSQFIDKIDAYIKARPVFMDLIFTKIKKDFSGGINVVVSGEFGNLFSKRFKSFFNKSANYNLITIPGSIRSKTANFKKLNLLFKDCVFVDDTYFTGKTFKKIGKEIKKLNGVFRKLYVVYTPKISKSGWLITLQTKQE